MYIELQTRNLICNLNTLSFTHWKRMQNYSQVICDHQAETKLKSEFPYIFYQNQQKRINKYMQIK